MTDCSNLLRTQDDALPLTLAGARCCLRYDLYSGRQIELTSCILVNMNLETMSTQERMTYAAKQARSPGVRYAHLWSDGVEIVGSTLDSDELIAFVPGDFDFDKLSAALEPLPVEDQR